MNWKRGFRRITFVLAVVVAVICASLTIDIVIIEHHIAQNHLRHKQELYRNRPKRIEDLNFEDLVPEEGKVPTAEQLKELEKGFWVNLSKKGLVGLCVLAGLIGAVVGFCSLWVVVWLLYRLFRWLILGFCGGEGKSGGREIILHAIANSDIFRVKQGTKVGDTVTSKNGYFLSDFYMKDVMEAKVVGFEDNDRPKPSKNNE